MKRPFVRGVWHPERNWRVGRNGLYYPLETLTPIKLLQLPGGRLELAGAP